MTADLGEVTVTELEEMLDDSDRRCEVTVSITVGVRAWTRTRRWTCRRRAKRLVLVTCTAHGDVRQGVCVQHLLVLRSGKAKVSCEKCGQPATWKPL